MGMVRGLLIFVLVFRPWQDDPMEVHWGLRMGQAIVVPFILKRVIEWSRERMDDGCL
jgi:hypothetical protein